MEGRGGEWTWEREGVQGEHRTRQSRGSVVKGGHDCEWQLRCGKVLILCLSLKSSLWRGAAYINHLWRQSMGYDETRYAVAILQPVQDRGGAGSQGGAAVWAAWKQQK